MKYKASFPVTYDLGPFSVIVSNKPMESKEDEALWHYNNCREHDGLGPVNELPDGTKFIPIFN